MSSAAETVLDLVQYIIQLAWSIPFQIPFFMFPFTFGHVIYGMIFIDVGVLIWAKFFKGNKDGGSLNG